MTTYAWTVYGTGTVLTLAVIGLLGTALFRLLGRVDTLSDRVHDDTARLSGAVERLTGRFDQVDQRFDRMDQRFDKVDQRFDKVDQRFDKVDQRFDRIEERQRTDKQEILERLDVLAERVTRLEAA